MIVSRRDLQEIASDVLGDYDRLAHRGATSRIDPHTLAEKVLGLSIFHRKLSQDGDTLGLTSMTPVEINIWNGDLKEPFLLDGHSILIDSGLLYGNGRYNYTVAHEVGHQIMYMTFPYEYDPLVLHRLTSIHLRQSETEHRITNWEEWYADTLASFLLMPEQLVLNCLKMFSLPRHIRSLNDPYPYNQHYNFSQMAKHLGVSRQALSIRLRQMGILDKPYIQKAYLRPIDINAEEM